MMRVGLVVIFLLSVLAGLAAFAPLSFALRQSGLVEQGLGWQQARGTIWQGQVTGLTWQGQALGAVNLETRLTAALTGSVPHKVTWSGPYGHGQAGLKAGPNSLSAADVNLSIPLTESTGVDRSFAGLGATLRVSEAQLSGDHTTCQTASGMVSTDLARLIASGFGRDWPILSGPLTCEAGKLQAILTGQAADGTGLRLVAAQGQGVRAELVPADNEVSSILRASGFREQGGTFVYDHILKMEEANR